MPNDNQTWLPGALKTSDMGNILIIFFLRIALPIETNMVMMILAIYFSNVVTLLIAHPIGFLQQTMIDFSLRHLTFPLNELHKGQ